VIRSGVLYRFEVLLYAGGAGEMDMEMVRLCGSLVCTAVRVVLALGSVLCIAVCLCVRWLC
jgi:hypothetical protein